MSTSEPTQRSLLPATTIKNLAKEAVEQSEPDCKMSAQASLMLNECATMFIHYLGASAFESASSKGKSTITPQDVLETLSEIGFDYFLDDATSFLDEIPTVMSPKRSKHRAVPLPDSAGIEGEQQEDTFQEEIEERKDEDETPES
ncbi:hypothetical protein BLNAU_3621 [Blattamonas nauphoetae]|uniref:Transcription factor CBF/NF-Y/archaeal histone domain-containing protein n=1 Tax=Blattamonas nauphoetae TaxID=2049346 RepID=A0ABQ9YCP4_9EUKA|nr:hypothetical protein BLNAU_3621 [Blattamonas nauphoetae]